MIAQCGLCGRGTTHHCVFANKRLCEGLDGSMFWSAVKYISGVESIRCCKFSVVDDVPRIFGLFLNGARTLCLPSRLSRSQSAKRKLNLHNLPIERSVTYPATERAIDLSPPALYIDFASTCTDSALQQDIHTCTLSQLKNHTRFHYS